MQIIFFGREYCPARRHDMSTCPICGWAASAQRIQAEKKKNTTKATKTKKPKAKTVKKAKATTAKKSKAKSVKKTKANTASTAKKPKTVKQAH